MSSLEIAGPLNHMSLISTSFVPFIQMNAGLSSGRKVPLLLVVIIVSFIPLPRIINGLSITNDLSIIYVPGSI